MKVRLFVDMDGTLCVFTPVEYIEELYEENRFLNAEPHIDVVNCVKNLIYSHSDEIEVYVLSCYLADSNFALSEKNKWLDRYLPEIDADHRIFVPCGEEKADYVVNGISENDYLLDDYTKNLCAWDPPGQGIKLLNGINQTRGTWLKNRVRYDRSGRDIARDICRIMNGEEIKDELPPRKTCIKSDKAKERG